MQASNELLEPVNRLPTEETSVRLAARAKSMNETIVFEEVTGLIVEFRAGVWWGVLSERLDMWKKCYDLFLQHSYPFLLTSTFFLDLCSKLEGDLFAKEQALLLCFANELLKQCSSKTKTESNSAIRDQSESFKVKLHLKENIDL